MPGQGAKFLAIGAQPDAKPPWAFNVVPDGVVSITVVGKSVNTNISERAYLCARVVGKAHLYFPAVANLFCRLGASLALRALKPSGSSQQASASCLDEQSEPGRASRAGGIPSTPSEFGSEGAIQSHADRVWPFAFVGDVPPSGVGGSAVRFEQIASGPKRFVFWGGGRLGSAPAAGGGAPQTDVGR